MNYIIYVPPIKPEGQAQGCILRWSLIFCFFRRWQSGNDVGNYSTSHGVSTWCNLVQAITDDFFCFSQLALHGVHIPCGDVWCGEVGICDAHVCTVCEPSVIVNCNHWPQPISEWQIRILSPGSMRINPATECLYLFYRMGRINPGSERMTEIISAVRGIQTHNLLIDRLAFYRWAIAGHFLNTNQKFTAQCNIVDNQWVSEHY